MNTPERGNGEFDTNQGDADNTQAARSPQDNNQAELVRISRLAVIACALTVLSLLLLPGFIRVFRKGTPQSVREVYQFITWGTAIGAAVLGVVSLARIGLRRGRLTG
ncbi:MAG: hypothetical protein ABFD90_21535, partial [Phycisphaerales bacterium]